MSSGILVSLGLVHDPVKGPAQERIRVTEQELEQVVYKHGDMYQHKDTNETVLFKFIDQNMVKIVSNDKDFKGEPLEYVISERVFKDDFIKLPDLAPRPNRGGNLSYST